MVNEDFIRLISENVVKHDSLLKVGKADKGIDSIFNPPFIERRQFRLPILEESVYHCRVQVSLAEGRIPHIPLIVNVMLSVDLHPSKM